MFHNPRMADFPAKFPVCREIPWRRARSPLRRQPGSAASGRASPETRESTGNPGFSRVRLCLRDAPFTCREAKIAESLRHSAIHAAVPMGPALIIDEVVVENGLHFLDGLEPGAALNAEVLVKQRAMQPFDDAGGLRAFDADGVVLDLLQLQEEFVGLLVGPSAEFAAIVGQHGFDFCVVLPRCSSGARR